MSSFCEISWTTLAFLLQFVSCVNTWLHVVTTTTLLNTYARMTIHSYCSRQDKKIGESSFNSRRRTHHIKVVTFTISVHEHKCGSSTHLLLPSSSVRMREGGVCHRPLARFVSLTHIITPPQQAVHRIRLLQCQTSLPLGHYLRVLDADLATTNSRPQTSCLQSLTLWGLELIRILNGCKPETELVGKIVARPSGSVTFNERGGPEVFEAWSWTCERLATSLSTGCSVLHTSEHYLSIILTADGKVAV